MALVAVTPIACAGCDQTTRSLARDHWRGRETAPFLGDTLRLQYIENPGAFLSLGASLPYHWRTAVFTMGTGGILAAVLLYAFLAAKTGPLQIVALPLICDGGIGNLVDRVRYDGYVTDFPNKGLGPVRTGIFNVTDVAPMSGMALLVLQHRRSEQPSGPRRGG